ncbi:MAG: GAF domain-containing protein [Nitrospinae bacterium]|nr:GAF domain-containing protein [Nitrospinota bacterium]
MTDAYTTALYAANLEQGTLTLRSHLTLSSHFKTDAAFAIGEGILGQAALRKEIRVDDFAGRETPELDWYAQPEEIKGLMVVPVVRRELEGVLVVDTKENYSFTPKLQKLIIGFADQMAW